MRRQQGDGLRLGDCRRPLRGKDYPILLSRALLFNAFERTLNGRVGMAFRKEPKLGSDVPEIIRGREEAQGQSRVEGWAENIDLQGAHWTCAFGRLVIRRKKCAFGSKR